MADWYDEFFTEAWPRIQTGIYTPERTKADCALILGALSLPEGARILDVPCGTGRHSIELARRGFSVTGVDASEEFISTAKQNASAAGVEPNLVVADMRSFVAEAPVDAVICFFGSFGYFDDAGDRAFVRSVVQSLRPGGQFLIDNHILETLLPIHRQRDWSWVGSGDSKLRVLEERTFVPETGRMEVDWTIVDETAKRSHRTSLRIYPYRELAALLRSAGFATVRLLDGKTGGEFRMGAPRALIVAEKA